jgi:hypothetical protein
MQYYDELARYDRGGFEIIVDKTWENLHPRDLFEMGDVEEICRKIDQGDLDWFMLRVRVLVDGMELGDHYLGGCCYEDAKTVLTDGTAEDCIYAAMEEAKNRLTTLAQKFTMLAIKHS